MSFKLIWKNEVIEENIPTLKEAMYLKNEYALAFYDMNIVIKNE